MMITDQKSTERKQIDLIFNSIIFYSMHYAWLTLIKILKKNSKKFDIKDTGIPHPQDHADPVPLLTVKKTKVFLIWA